MAVNMNYVAFQVKRENFQKVTILSTHACIFHIRRAVSKESLRVGEEPLH